MPKNLQVFNKVNLLDIEGIEGWGEDVEVGLFLP